MSKYQTMRIKSFAFLLCSSALLLSCERPFVDIAEPEVTIVSPDIGLIQTGTEVEIIAEVSTGFRDINFVELNSSRMTYNAQTEQWTGILPLLSGRNTFSVTARDDTELEGTTTASILRYIPKFTIGPDLPVALGGHTFTDQSIGSFREYLLLGGSQSTLSPAEKGLYKVTFDRDEISYLKYESELSMPRAGHTTIQMRDGNSLILGGSVRAEARSIDDLVEVVERFNKETGEVEIVPFDGLPIRRSRHQAIRVENIDGEEFIYLHGGQGDIRYGDDPRLGIRDDFRLFAYRNDSLIAIGPQPFGTRIASAMAGHSVIPLTQNSGNGFGTYLVSTTEFDSGDLFNAIHLRLGLAVNSINRSGIQDSFRQPRTEYATARFTDGLIAFFGGRRFAQNTALGTAELFSQQVSQYFLLPDISSMQGTRWDLSATKIPDGRILVTGGFDSSGNAVRSTDFFSIL